MNIHNVVVDPRFAFHEAKKQMRFAVHVRKNELEFRDDGTGGKYIRIPELDLELHVVVGSDGKPKLDFEYFCLSDTHLGTRQSRAKRTCQFLEHSRARRLDLIGDIIDGEHLLGKEEWKFPEYHRQVEAHFLRKVSEGTEVNYIPGNHDIKLRNQTILFEGKNKLHHNLCGKTFQGIKFSQYTYYTDPKGRRFKIIHGDQFDDVLFGKSKGMLYNIGSAAYDALIEVDTRFQSIERFQDISIAAIGKRATKFIINYGLGVRYEMLKLVADDPTIDGIIYGHSHMQEMTRTPDGKLIINDGNGCEHVQGSFNDRFGTWANLECHRDRLVLEGENRQRRTVPLHLIGMDDMFRKEATIFKDIYTERADDLCRSQYRLWPPLERQRQQAMAEIARRQLNRGVGELLMKPIPLPKRQRKQQIVKPSEFTLAA